MVPGVPADAGTKQGGPDSICASWWANQLRITRFLILRKTFDFSFQLIPLHPWLRTNDAFTVSRRNNWLAQTRTEQTTERNRRIPTQREARHSMSQSHPMTRSSSQSLPLQVRHFFLRMAALRWEDHWAAINSGELAAVQEFLKKHPTCLNQVRLSTLCLTSEEEGITKRGSLGCKWLIHEPLLTEESWSKRFHLVCKRLRPPGGHDKKEDSPKGVLLVCK